MPPTTPAFERPLAETLRDRLVEPRRFIEVLSGPRQVGKTTLVRQALDSIRMPSHYASADTPTLEGRAWLETQWLRARRLTHDGAGAVLVLDEVQKIPQWSDAVKALWDEDTGGGVALHVVLLGSAPLLVQRGLSESLAGRFELIRMSHWSFAEMRDAFGWDLDQYIFFGGYPGAAPLIDDEARWRSYVLDSLIETTVSRDIMLLTRIDKPALLRRLLALGCDYSGQILSFTKMLGQLHDAGNTTTLAHYLDLLGGAGLLAGLQKYGGNAIRRRASSPKLVALNTALISATSGRTFRQTRSDTQTWGRLVESAVGAHLLADLGADHVFYWRDRNLEVDYVIRGADEPCAIEVKSGREHGSRSGLGAFAARFPQARALVAGGDGMPLRELLETPPRDLFA